MVDCMDSLVASLEKSSSGSLLIGEPLPYPSAELPMQCSLVYLAPFLQVRQKVVRSEERETATVFSDGIFAVGLKDMERDAFAVRAPNFRNLDCFVDG